MGAVRQENQGGSHVQESGSALRVGMGKGRRESWNCGFTSRSSANPESLGSGWGTASWNLKLLLHFLPLAQWAWGCKCVIRYSSWEDLGKIRETRQELTACEAILGSLSWHHILETRRRPVLTNWSWTGKDAHDGPGSRGWENNGKLQNEFSANSTRILQGHVLTQADTAKTLLCSSSPEAW